MPRDIAIPFADIKAENALADWKWIVPHDDTPLMVGAFGDVVLGAPDGSLWLLCLLEGDYTRVARNAAEFNELKRDSRYLDVWFKAHWVAIAQAHGIIPRQNECLGWKLPPIIGGPMTVEHIQIFSVRVYLSLQGQLHRQIRGL